MKQFLFKIIINQVKYTCCNGLDENIWNKSKEEQTTYLIYKEDLVNHIENKKQIVNT